MPDKHSQITNHNHISDKDTITTMVKNYRPLQFRCTNGTTYIFRHITILLRKTINWYKLIQVNTLIEPSAYQEFGIFRDAHDGNSGGFRPSVWRAGLRVGWRDGRWPFRLWIYSSAVFLARPVPAGSCRVRTLSIPDGLECRP